MTVKSQNRREGGLGVRVHWGVAMLVRPIRAEELIGWVEAMHVAFHNDWSAEQEAALRRDHWQQDYARSLAGFDDDALVGTYESFTADLTLPGGDSVRADAVSAVSVLPTHRRRGLLSQMIDIDLRAARERDEVASILTPSEYPIYGRYGFGPAAMRVELVLDAALTRFTRPGPGKVVMVPAARLRELAPPIFERVRTTRPGQIDRRWAGWDTRLGLLETPWRRTGVIRCATYTSDSGALEGYVTFRSEEDHQQHRPGSRIQVLELMALTPGATRGLWRFCCEMDLVSEVRATMRPIDDPIYWLLDDPRAAIRETRCTDYLWLLPLDVARLLGARRYSCENRLVLEVTDPRGLSGGRFALEGGPDGATCVPTSATAQLSMSMTALGTIALGGQPLHPLVEAGLIEEHSPGAAQRADLLFRWPLAPWCSTMF